jgi:hypothetical protein
MTSMIWTKPKAARSRVIVVLLGLLPPLGLLGGQAAHADGHTGHHHRARVGWLLLVPVLVVLVVQPAVLGSYAVSSRSAMPAGGGDGGFPPLAAPVQGAIPMSMAEFVTRALRDPGQSLAGVRVRLVGFVAPAKAAPAATGCPLHRFLLRRRRRSFPGRRPWRPHPTGP